MKTVNNKLNESPHGASNPSRVRIQVSHKMKGSHKMKINSAKTIVLSMVVLGMSMMGRSVPTDGYFDHPGNSQKTGDAYRWLNGVVAGDGGTMVVGGVYASPVHTMNFNQGGVLLGNLLFVHEGIISVMGDPITMSGDAPVVKMRNPSDKSNSGFNRRAGYFDAQLSGTGSNTLVKDGGGKWIMKQPITGFAEVYVKDGGLVATNNDSAAAVTDCPLRLSGYLGYQSSHLSSDTGADWAASGAANGLTVEAGDFYQQGERKFRRADRWADIEDNERLAARSLFARDFVGTRPWRYREAADCGNGA